MQETGFRFKQFTVQHRHSSMKVGTDAVLLGAWAKCPAKGRLLDIGTGCGVIALMMAQRFPLVEVMGIDIDVASVDEATSNARRANMQSRVSFLAEDVRLTDASRQFDCIVCNPPYFTEDTLPPDNRRSLARNAKALSFPALVAAANNLLSSTGTFSVVLPTKEVEGFVAECRYVGLSLIRRCDVRTTPRKEPKRTLLSFSRCETNQVQTEHLILMSADGKRSEQYAALTHDFYL